MQMQKNAIVTGAFLAALGCGLPIFAQDLLETESCRLLKQGDGKVVNAIEVQTSKDGREIDIPLVFELGILDSLEAEIEPVAYVSVHPRTGRNVSGVGDVEATLKYLFLPESDPYPALAIAGELKIPTAKDTLIGTGEPDYTLTLVASKKLGDFDLHANLGYSITGSPRGVTTTPTISPWRSSIP
jgi:hypothetical protein